MQSLIKKLKKLFKNFNEKPHTDCGVAAEMTNAVKTVDSWVDLDQRTRLERVVSYECEEGTFVAPPSADLVHRCVEGGAWNSDGGVCARGLLNLLTRFMRLNVCFQRSFDCKATVSCLLQKL